MRKRFSRKQKASLLRVRKLSIALFCGFMAAGTLGGLLFFARPSYSAAEKRDLTPFPALTLSTFLNGDWFKQISLWYSDTYPARDTLMSAQQTIEKLNGIQSREQVIGIANKSDEIGKADRSSKSSSTSSEESRQFENRTAAPEMHGLAEDIQGQIMEGLLIRDGAAYGGYYFLQDSYDVYTQALERAARELEGITDVYSILVPNNSGVLLDQETLDKLAGADQKQAIDYYYSNYSDLIHPVGTIDTLREHKDEYLYFRTDHHWTQLAAYYVYQNFCQTKGIDPIEKESLEQIHFEPFLGSYASELPSVELTADSLDGWVPKDTNTMRIYTDTAANPESTEYYENPIVNTSEMIDQYSQYMRFIGGDQGFEMIDNPAVNDGSSCLVIKESYGNAFVPWLTSHYDKIYVMDFRYSDIPIVTWCKDHQIQDLILINNIQLAAAGTVADRYDLLLH